MLRIATLVLVVLALPAAAFAARRPDRLSIPAPLIAKVVACEVTTDERSAVFYARMDALPGAAKMAVRFQLFERLGRGEAWEKVDVPALRQWRTSQAGVKRFGWKQSLENLNLGGAYRARVQFRWLSAAGNVLEAATKETPVCRGPLPNLTIGDVSIRPGPTADTRIYRVQVQNSSKTDVDGVDVSLTVDRAVLDTVTLTRLDAGASRSVTFTGPACRREVRAEVDPENAVGERAEGDNYQVFSCP